MKKLVLGNCLMLAFLALMVGEYIEELSTDILPSYEMRYFTRVKGPVFLECAIRLMSAEGMLFVSMVPIMLPFLFLRGLL